MLEFLETPLTVLHIVVSLFLVLVILIQPGKSGGLGAALGGAGAQQVFGGRGAGNFLSRMTWISAGIFFMTSVLLAYISSSTEDSLADRRKPADVEQLSVIKPEPKSAAEGAAQGNTPAQGNAPAGEPAAPIEQTADEASEQAVGDAPKPDDAVSDQAAKSEPVTGSAIEDAPVKGAPKAPAVPGPKVPRAAEPKAPKAPAAPVAPQAATPKAPETPKAPAEPVAPKPEAPAPATPPPTP